MGRGKRKTVTYDVVDLGTKHGNAIDEFRKRGLALTLPERSNDLWLPHRCLGVERPQAENYRRIVTDKGYCFELIDCSDERQLKQLPPGNVYLSWHFLEHLPSKNHAYMVTHTALTNATELVWFRLPSFEPDDICGEGVLLRQGCRFTWTNWTGHPTRWLLEDARRAISSWTKQNQDRPYELIVRPGQQMVSIEDPRIVPIDAPVDTVKYHPSLGKKPTNFSFPRPIVAEWEVILRYKKCKSEQSNFKISVPIDNS
jgi:hypothetical protein